MFCENCGKEHNGQYGSGRFCSKECAKSFSTKNISKTKTVKCSICGKDMEIPLRSGKKENICYDCYKKYKKECNIFDINCENCYFKLNKLCTSKSAIKYKLNTLVKYLNLEISDYNSTLNSYLELKNIIQNMINSGLSSNEICESLFGNCKKGNTIFSILQINTRNLQDAVVNAFNRGKMNAKAAYHITWNNKEVYLRSSYELDFAKELDENKIDYEVETLNIKYWDSQLLKYRKAIPDFYLPETNTIVEIKSSWTYDKQNMIDKKTAYLKAGYNFKLYLNHKETGL